MFLPLFIVEIKSVFNCVLLITGSDMSIDDRSFVMQAVTIMDIPSSLVFFYPQLIPLHDIDVDSNELPSSIRCTSDKIRDDGVYLLGEYTSKQVCR
jgi:protein transport protein SEC24